MFSKIDSWLIDSVFQPFSWKIQQLFGFTNFTLARWSNVCFAVNILVGYPFWVEEWKRPPWLFVVMTVALLLWVFSEDRIFLRKEREFIQGKRTMNERRITNVWSRKFIGPWLVFKICTHYLFREHGIAEIADLLFVQFWFLTEYFAACTPLPPSKSKARDFWEKLLWKADEVLSPKPEPVPVRIPQ